MFLVSSFISFKEGSLVLSSVDATTGVATITLNHPARRNALSSTMLLELGDQLDSVTADEATRVIIIKSSHPIVFSSGHDLNELLRGSTGAELTKTELHDSHVRLFNLCSQVMLKVHNAPQPIIAEVNGVATAAGCQLVATCDLAIAANDARFGTPGVNIGLFCSTPAVPLARSVHPKHALEMLLTGDMLSAQRAQEIGLVNRVVPKQMLSEEVLKLAQQIASKPKSAIRIGKRAFRKQVEMSLVDAYAHTGPVMVDNMDTGNAQEGIGAFLEKRKPTWHQGPISSL
jgi:enoyl-CoA hydratase/carnithine racemase